jgi:hypothetical protein
VLLIGQIYIKSINLLDFIEKYFFIHAFHLFIYPKWNKPYHIGRVVLVRKTALNGS